MIHISKPTFLVRRDLAERNIHRMAEKARSSGTVLRPHFKTHQSKEIGRWFRKAGIDTITVSSVTMAEYFAAAGWDDITIAFPVNLLESDRIDTLSRKVRLGLLTDSAIVAAELGRHLQSQIDIWIKIDTGYHRTGILWNALPALNTLADTIRHTDNLRFRGLLTHAGHSYHVKDQNERIRLFAETADRLNAARQDLPASLRKDCLLSTGDTPTCTAVERFTGVDEVRPGNFVFFDLQQLMLGSCTEEDIAAAVICPVVGTYPERGEAVIYGGAVHLSKQAELLPNNTPIYGFAVPWNGSAWGKINTDHYVREISQEHGIIRYGSVPPVKPGDLVAILPVHSCLTMNLLKEEVMIF